jgi:hypothetical protein
MAEEVVVMMDVELPLLSRGLPGKLKKSMNFEGKKGGLDRTGLDAMAAMDAMDGLGRDEGGSGSVYRSKMLPTNLIIVSTGSVSSPSPYPLQLSSFAQHTLSRKKTDQAIGCWSDLGPPGWMR